MAAPAIIGDSSQPRRTWRSVAPDLVALAVGLAVPLAMSSSAWGVLQRLMFLTAACWYGREAWNAPDETVQDRALTLLGCALARRALPTSSQTAYVRRHDQCRVDATARLRLGGMTCVGSTSS